ncbi:MAG TPA: alkaline phosphatase family protein [Actinomycetota bacterium]|nr:alkaline phosphatase family protein [Actinomycetota bacterium]
MGIRLVLAVCFAAACACSAPRSSAPSIAPAPASVPKPAKSAERVSPVVLIVMENHSSTEIMGSANAGYLHRFARAGTLFTDMTAVAHPSLPNYLAMTAGSTLGCHDDACPTRAYGSPNLFHQLQRAGRRWRAWEESMPGHCALSDAGHYAVRHDPAAYFRNLFPNGCPQRVLPYPAALPKRLPDFTFITPNLCSDMHDDTGCGGRGPIARGNAWLYGHVPPLLRRGAIVIVTFDEGVGSDQRIYCAVRGPGVAAHRRDGHRYTHLGLLAGLERHFGLPRIHGALTARPLPI